MLRWSSCKTSLSLMGIQIDMRCFLIKFKVSINAFLVPTVDHATVKWFHKSSVTKVLKLKTNLDFFFQFSEFYKEKK